MKKNYVKRDAVANNIFKFVIIISRKSAKYPMQSFHKMSKTILEILIQQYSFYAMKSVQKELIWKWVSPGPPMTGAGGGAWPLHHLHVLK